MKTLILIITTLLSVGVAKAQMGLSTGITFVPQAKMDPKNVSKGFNPFFNLFPQFTITGGKWFGVGFYSIAFNNVGVAVGYKPTAMITSYIVTNKSVMTSSDYLGFGIGTPLAEKRATGFIEFGSGTRKWEPAIYVGMFIPFSIVLRK